MYQQLRFLAAAAAFLAGAVGLAQSPDADVLAVLKGHADTVDAVAVSADGRLAATGSFDKTVKLWDVATGKELRTFGGPQGHQGQVLAVGFSPAGDLLASGGADNQVKVWESAAGVPAGKLAAAAAVLGGRAALAWGGEFLPPEQKTARRLVFAAANPVKSLQHPNLVDSVAFDPTGTLLATGCHDGKLRIWDVAKGAVTKEVAAHVQTTPQNVAHPIYCVVWAPGGKQVLTASYDRSLKLWDAADGKLVREFRGAADPKPEPKPKDKMEAKKDGKKDEPKKEAKKDEPKKEEPKKDEPPAPKGPPGHRDQVFTAVFSKDGKFLATGGSDRAVKLWDVATGEVARDFPAPDQKPVLPGEPAASHPGWVHAVRFTPDDKHLVTVGPAPRYKGYVAVWAVADGKRVYGAERDIGPVHGLAVTPDGSKLVLGCGPKGRTETDAAALVVKMPGR